MELFIRANDIYMEIHKVTLKDGHIPMIGEHLPSFLSDTDYGYCNPRDIEPAVWFKVMVVDSISIDCTKRAIMWNSDSSLPYVENRESRNSKQCRRRVSESMYIGGELYGFETDLDELFDTLQTTVISFASSQISRDDFNGEVMRMLHCHVLPLIKLTTEDVPKMKMVYAEEEKYIQAIDEAIIDKDKQMDGIAKAMQRQRDAFLSSFVTVKENDQSVLTNSAKLCNTGLAQVLVDDCESDLLMLHQRLDDVQGEVEEAKRDLAQREGMDADKLSKSMEGSVSSEDQVFLSNIPQNESEPQKKLRETREERNECHRKLKRLLCARENLRVLICEAEIEEEKQRKKSFIKSFKSSPQHELLPIHNVYLGMRDTLNEVKNKAKALVDKKVLMISVKEALRTTLHELEVNEESLGVDVGVMHGSRPTDVLHRSRKPKEWLSLAEQVSDLVGHHSNEVCLRHNNIAKIVADQCQAAVFEKKLMDMSYNAARTSESTLESETDKSDSGVYVENKLFSIRSKRDPEMDSAHKIGIEGMKIEKASPVNSVISDTSDLGTGSESRVSSGSTSQSELSSLQNDSAATSSPATDMLIQVEGQLGDEDIVIVHNNSRDHLRIAIDDLKLQIQEHFDGICKLIQASIENHMQTANKKVWLCYENHFYEATMEPLMELYKNAFKSVSARFEHLVPHLTVEDLDLDDTIIANMLEEKVAKFPAEEEHSNAESNSTADGALGDPQRGSVITDEAVQTKSEPVSPTSDSVFSTPPEAPPTALKSSKAKIRNCSGGLMIHSVQENTSSTPPKDSKRVQCTTCRSAGGLQRIRVHSPMSVTVVRNRQSWPQNSPLNHISESIEVGLEALHLQPRKNADKRSSTFDNIRRSLFSQEKDAMTTAPMTPPLSSVTESSDGVSPIVYRDVKLKPEFLQKFSVAKNCLNDTLTGVTPLIKLQSLMRCLREVTNCLSEYQFQCNNNDAGACSDDIIDMLIILLLNCDASLVAALYPHLMFLADTLPPFFEGGPYQFCLVQFSVAYQFLQDRLLLKNHSVHKDLPSCIY